MEIKSVLKNLTMPFIALTLLTLSCNKDDTGPSETFYQDKDYVFSYKVIGDDVEFFIDAIIDKNNAIWGTWPEKDVYRIYVDYNQNGAVDNGIDLLIGTHHNNETCVAKLVSQTVTTACAFYPEVFESQAFSATENASEKHVNFKVTVPKNILSNGSGANVVIQVHDAETGWHYFPSTNPFFTDFYEISF